ncbi:fimbrial protein [Entomohabitans teleogrylli]|uniref:fimbrial protein n=1 Tax=Entomohabitans teleogrylli TaxID=1384589 RepID=UPI0008FC6C88|nr:fimbrial protein [Entomohabitans teleogrylli]
MKNNLLPLMVACSLGAVTLSSLAQDGGVSYMHITGTVVEPECVINNNQQIEVDFGEVLTTRVDGVNYETQIRYSLSCSNLLRNTLKINLRGTPASFNGGLFMTDVAGLGIRVYDASKTAVIPNSGELQFTYAANNPPALYAVPVAQNAAALPGGAFNGSATMVLSYQ